VIGQHKRDLSIVPYRSEWKELFKEEADLLRSALGNQALRIEHTGSTSIPGMAAKPIIDITIAVDSLSGAVSLIPVIEALGYEYKPHDTVPERIFFAKESFPEHRTHHLNLTEQGSGFWKTQITFRDYLRSHKEMAVEYIQLKEGIAEEYNQTHILDPESKSEFVARVLQLAEDEDKKQV